MTNARTFRLEASGPAKASAANPDKRSVELTIMRLCKDKIDSKAACLVFLSRRLKRDGGATQNERAGRSQRSEPERAPRSALHQRDSEENVPPDSAWSWPASTTEVVHGRVKEMNTCNRKVTHYRMLCRCEKAYPGSIEPTRKGSNPQRRRTNILRHVCSFSSICSKPVHKISSVFYTSSVAS